MCSTAPVDRRRIGIFLGAGTSDLIRNEQYQYTTTTRGIAHARPSHAWNHFSSTPVDVIASRFGLEGPRSCIVAACASSTIAIGQAADAVRTGRADVAVAGGTDALARLTFSGFNALRLMDPAPCRPFDRGRAGMNIGEGAGMLVLEDMERARARGAHIYGELAGYSLRLRGVSPHRTGTGWPAGARGDSGRAGRRRDRRQTPSTTSMRMAPPRHRTIGPRRAPSAACSATRTRQVPVTSLKSMLGHCLGAAGALEAAALALTVSRGVIPPTINHGETDPECGIDGRGQHRTRAAVRCGVSTSLGFGGNDAALVITAVE